MKQTKEITNLTGKDIVEIEKLQFNKGKAQVIKETQKKIQKLKGRLKEEAYKLANEMSVMQEQIRNSATAKICPICDKVVKSRESRIKIVEYIKNPKVNNNYGDWIGKVWVGAFKSRVIGTYHLNCWRRNR